MNYVNKLQPASLTPNPKLFELNKSVVRNKKQHKKEGENFAGLQTYIISEIDSGSDDLKSAEDKFLSDASSFSNSSDDLQKNSQQNSSQSEDNEEKQDVVFGAMLGDLTSTTGVINKIWQQTPMVKQQAEQKGFITSSPFSFQKPIFYSVPRDNGNKKVKLIRSKRELFGHQPSFVKQKHSSKTKVFPLFN